jgi:hypothetical protein
MRCFLSRRKSRRGPTENNVRLACGSVRLAARRRSWRQTSAGRVASASMAARAIDPDQPHGPEPHRHMCPKIFQKNKTKKRDRPITTRRAHAQRRGGIPPPYPASSTSVPFICSRSIAAVSGFSRFNSRQGSFEILMRSSPKMPTQSRR